MSALAEALLAAQRQAVGALAKAFVAGKIEDAEFLAELDHIGLRDDVDQGLLVHALGVVKDHGGEAPKPTGQNGPKLPEPASSAQLNLITKLCREKNLSEPDVVSSKQQASEIITAIQDGRYVPDAYSVPF